MVCIYIYIYIYNKNHFGPCNCLLKIQKSIKTPTHKVGAHLGVWEFILSHSLTFPRAWNVIPGFHLWPAPLQALALVANPRLRLGQTSILLIMNMQEDLWKLALNNKIFYCLETKWTTNMDEKYQTIDIYNPNDNKNKHKWNNA